MVDTNLVAAQQKSSSQIPSLRDGRFDWSRLPDPWRWIGPQFRREAVRISGKGFSLAERSWSKDHGKKLRELRNARGATAASLAAVIGVHETIIQRWERGVLSPSKNHRAALRKILSEQL